MDRRFEVGKQKILDQAPFVDSLGRREAKQNARVYISGLLSDLERKNVESIAYRHDQDRLEELAQQAGAELGEDDGVIVFDPSAHKKCGNDSVGVKRQWLGRLGKIDNGQVGIYMGYASRKEQSSERMG